MTPSVLASVEVATGANPTASVIWMHGLGADGHDFEPAVPQLVRSRSRALRFVFPHAPVRPVTLNGGYPMRAWFDIVKIGLNQPRGLKGMEASRQAVEALVARERQRGVPASRTVLAGFSQGGAVALYAGLQHPERLAGLMALSTYLPVGEGFDVSINPANAHLPVFYGHGIQDPVVPLQLGEYTRNWLTQQG